MKVSRKVMWAGAVGCLLTLSTGALVYAQFNPQPEPPAHYYGLMTLPAGQSISLHVSNAKMAVDAFRPERSMCVAEMRFVDACGQTLSRRVVRIDPRLSASLNFTVPPVDPEHPPDPAVPPDPGVPPDPLLPPDPCIAPLDATGIDEVPPDPGKTKLRAQVLFSGPAGHCVSSVEVGDPFAGGDSGNIRASGGFEHPAVIVGFNPQPDPPGRFPR